MSSQVAMVIIAIAQAVAVVLLAPLVSGFSRWMRAKLHTRKGPSILQDYYDIAKLLKRQDVHTKQSSWIHRIMPALFFGVMFVLAMGVPMFTAQTPVRAFGDVILIIYMLALVRFFYALASVDNGDPYGGVGGIRELLMGVLAEPTMMMTMFVVAVATMTTNVGDMGMAIMGGDVPNPIAIVLTAIAFAMDCYVELGKTPFDLSEAEQEIQEGPLQGYSGPSLALLHIAMPMKQIIVVSWFFAIFIPWGAAMTLTVPAILLGIVAFLVKIFIAFFLCSFEENLMARVRYKFAGRQTWVVFGTSVLALVFCLMGI